VNAASTATPTPARPHQGTEPDPLRTEPLRPSGDAGDGWGRAAAYDAYADGLHTYAIWSLRDHDAAVDALYCAFVMADRHVTQLRQPEHVHPWLYAIVRHECQLRAAATSSAPSPVSGRLRPPSGAADPGGSLAALERSLRRAEFHSLEWPESEGLVPAHREILELTIRHGLDSQGLGLVLGLGQHGRGAGPAGRHTASRSAAARSTAGLVGSAGSQGFGVLADAWRELERSLAAVAVAKGSREHCAQLAELTFGWSGRLTATLRAPLTDHVDGCTRCQHYLHTVIGTPAAPTILPFVAAPRTLRDIVLGELHDPKTARAEGVDHAAIARRLENFTADGFPAADEPSPVRRRGGRRAQERHPRSDETLPRHTPGANLPGGRGAAPEGVADDLVGGPDVGRAGTGAASAAKLGRPTPQADVAAVADSVYRAPGSWAARVLPPLDDAESTRHWRPSDSGSATRTMRARAGSSSPGMRRSTSATHYGSGTGTPSGSDPHQHPTFVSTPSGRFAVHAPGAGTGAFPTSTLPTLNFAAPAVEPPRGPDGKPRARHKSRPVRQAVTSAVALGAVGAVAAVSAALLGLTSEDHAQAVLGDPGLSKPIGPGADSGGLTVTVSTAPAAAPTSPAAPAAPLRPTGTAVPAAGTGISGLAAQSTPPGSPATPAAPGQPTADPADFHVSVNQRSADANTVVIVLRNTGAVSIAWTATAQDSWIVLSQTSGTLGAGQSQAITATATGAAPSGAWVSRITFAPGDAVVTIRGGIAHTPPPSATPPPSTSPTPPPTTPPTQPPPTQPAASTPPTDSSSPGGGAGGPSPSSVRQSGGGPSASAAGRGTSPGAHRK
jgi:DNA-directed RNA polymerase specialized sigma24 family protein